MEKDIYIPDGIEVNEQRGELTITYKWFKLIAIFLAFFSAFWLGGLAVIYAMLFNEEFQQVALIAGVFTLGHLAVGIGLGYYSLCLFLNKTVITVDRLNLHIYHKPLPWFGQLTIDWREIKQIFVKETMRSNKGQYSYSYALQALTKSGRKMTLMKDIDRSEVAQYLEEKLEQYLKIEDQPVNGEFGKY
jgi:hypothetical protein